MIFCLALPESTWKKCGGIRVRALFGTVRKKEERKGVQAFAEPRRVTRILTFRESSALFLRRCCLAKC